MKAIVFLTTLCLTGPALAKGPQAAPEDILKGQIIIAEKPLPTRWTSVSAYVAQLRSANRTTLFYDKKNPKLKIEYAAFFAKPVNDVQVDLVIYDVTGGRKERKATTENFMNRGDRALFNSILLDREDFEMNRKYMFAIESRRATIATGTFTLRGEGERYSGKVTFTEEEAKLKKNEE